MRSKTDHRVSTVKHYFQRNHDVILNLAEKFLLFWCLYSEGVCMYAACLLLLIWCRMRLCGFKWPAVERHRVKDSQISMENWKLHRVQKVWLHFCCSTLWNSWRKCPFGGMWRNENHIMPSINIPLYIRLFDSIWRWSALVSALHHVSLSFLSVFVSTSSPCEQISLKVLL